MVPAQQTGAGEGGLAPEAKESPGCATVWKADTSWLRIARVVMRKPDVYWQIYRQDQIKPQWRGRLIYVLEIPRIPGTPVLRHVFDPTGGEFPRGEGQRNNLLRRLPHGIIYEGVNRTAVFEVMRFDPRISPQDPAFIFYNRKVVHNSRRFFLTRRCANRWAGEVVERCLA